MTPLTLLLFASLNLNAITYSCLTFRKIKKEVENYSKSRLIFIEPESVFPNLIRGIRDSIYEHIVFRFFIKNFLDYMSFRYAKVYYFLTLFLSNRHLSRIGIYQILHLLTFHFLIEESSFLKGILLRIFNDMVVVSSFSLFLALHNSESLK